MERIINKDLEYLTTRINEITNNPTVTYQSRDGGGYKSNIGCYYIDGAYGGVKLVQIVNDGGGIREISTIGYGTKRELYNWLQAYVKGLETEKK